MALCGRMKHLVSVEMLDTLWQNKTNTCTNYIVLVGIFFVGEKVILKKRILIVVKVWAVVFEKFF